MTNEKLFMTVTDIIRNFVELEKDNFGITDTAEEMIKDPASWLAEYGKAVYHPSITLMAKAAEILLDCIANMNKGSSSDEKKAAAAAKRYYKTAHEEGQRLPALDGVWEADGYYNICDSHRILRLVKDRPELPKLQYEGQKFNVKSIMDATINDTEKVIIEAPDIVSVKTFLAAEKARIKGIKGASVKPYIIKDPAGRPLIGLNPQFIIDALEALPGAVWYGSADNKPVYVVSEDGDSLLLPVFIRNTDAGAAKEDITKTWDEYKKAAASVNFTPAAAAAAEETPQTDSAKEAASGAEAAPRKRRSRKAAEPQKAEAEAAEEAQKTEEGAAALTAAAEAPQEPAGSAKKATEATEAPAVEEYTTAAEKPEKRRDRSGRSFKIAPAKIKSWGYEVTGPGFHNIAPSIEAATQYLKDRYGLGVKITIIEAAAEDSPPAPAEKAQQEAPACQHEAAPEDAAVTPQKAQEGQQKATQDIYNACDARSAGRPTKGAKNSICQSAPAEAATPSGRKKPAPSAAAGSASSCDAFPGLRAAGSGAAGPGQERPAAASRASPQQVDGHRLCHLGVVGEG